MSPLPSACPSPHFYYISVYGSSDLCDPSPLASISGSGTGFQSWPRHWRVRERVHSFSAAPHSAFVAFWLQGLSPQAQVGSHGPKNIQILMSLPPGDQEPWAPFYCLKGRKAKFHFCWWPWVAASGRMLDPEAAIHSAG